MMVFILLCFLPYLFIHSFIDLWQCWFLNSGLVCAEASTTEIYPQLLCFVLGGTQALTSYPSLAWSSCPLCLAPPMLGLQLRTTVALHGLSAFVLPLTFCGFTEVRPYLDLWFRLALGHTSNLRPPVFPRYGETQQLSIYLTGNMPESCYKWLGFRPSDSRFLVSYYKHM